jgi:hypothetical protein
LPRNYTWTQFGYDIAMSQVDDNKCKIADQHYRELTHQPMRYCAPMLMGCPAIIFQ